MNKGNSSKSNCISLSSGWADDQSASKHTSLCLTKQSKVCVIKGLMCTHFKATCYLCVTRKWQMYVRRHYWANFKSPYIGHLQHLMEEKINFIMFSKTRHLCDTKYSSHYDLQFCFKHYVINYTKSSHIHYNTYSAI